MEISVLMSVYDKEKPEYLRQSLDSILSQTLLPKEIVIIKDGNLTDELEVVLKEYKNNYPEMIYIYGLKEHLGLGVALKYGVKKCNCDYIARMDTDDIATPYRLEEQAKILSKNPNLDILRRIYRRI